MHFENQPHIPPSTPGGSTASFTSLDIPHHVKKHRGSYNCGRCGLPKKGHVCHLPPTSTTTTTPTQTPTDSSVSVSNSLSRPPPRQQYSNLRRALSFDDSDLRCDSPEVEIDESEMDLFGSGCGKLPVSCMWEIFRRLPPAGLLAAGSVCKGWRETARRLWRAAEELRLRVPPRSQPGFVGSVLQKCPGLSRLNLRLERGFVLCSSSLSTLWLSDLYCLSKMVFNCPNLKEISLDFSRQENDSTDLIAMVDGLGRSCPRLQNVHVASVRLSHAAVLALTAANLRGCGCFHLFLELKLLMQSVVAISQSYSKLELLDLSGSSISDSGIGMICKCVSWNTFKASSCALSEHHFKWNSILLSAQLPLLELMDCGMTICDLSSHRLKKLSLWGCSGLDALYLNCPELIDLNLNSCKNLHPERVLLQCPSLESVHASGCHNLLIEGIQSQVSNNFAAMENQFPNKRLADGLKEGKGPAIPEPAGSHMTRIRSGEESRVVLVTCLWTEQHAHHTCFILYTLCNLYACCNLSLLSILRPNASCKQMFAVVRNRG
ncbi:hypothetical protein NC653_005458 [Populus alba x Populus x berolinensis]|uniref:F-box domain-containing protein n=1 Tax=Populus alba x Populus x berolinensis TaxID=444605 RepID=A0AAD6WBV8_9ROSI|nr:hypothetical protein NC653_005458 [Populus alba x Populus x berolinensis]